MKNNGVTADGIPAKGYWYELVDFSSRDYGSSWGYKLYKDGREIYSSGGICGRIWQAGDAAREHKHRLIEQDKRKP